MPRYDITKSYEWNYGHAPDRPGGIEPPVCQGKWDFCGLSVGSPLGIPAGPLLNSRWILYYASLGFSVLTYKTVRSLARRSYDPPNLLPVTSPQLAGQADQVLECTNGEPLRSWAISFGMPSKDPREWQEDISAARKGLAPDQVLVVSVVASPQPDWNLDQIGDDFAQCARWAKNAGAQAIEANLSCPNVCSQEGQLYMSPHASGLIAAAMKSAVGDLPLILKIGLFASEFQAEAFLAAIKHHANALSTVNSISATVRTPDGKSMFDGLSRGIGGECIRNRSQAELEMLRGVIRRAGANLRLVGVGGIFSATDVRERIAAGAHHVQLATAAMLDPLVAIRIRRDLASVSS